MHFSPDGAQLAIISAYGAVRVWDTATGSEVTRLTGHTGGVNAVAFSPDGTHLATAGADGTIRMWDAATGAEQAPFLGHVGAVNAIAFSPDGIRLATAGSDGTVRLWAATGTGTPVVAGPGNALIDATPDDTAHAAAEPTPFVEIATLIGFPESGWAALFPDGSYKLEGNPAGRLWWALGLTRFEAGELDPYIPSIRRLPADAPLP